MAITCDELRSAVQGVSLIEDCDVIESGALRLATPFRYPDGSNVDLFVVESLLLLGNRYRLTDLGQTTAYLLDVHMKPWGTKRRKQVVDDVCRTLDVQHEGGQLVLPLTDGGLSHLSEAIVRLAQACIRIADISQSLRLWAPSTFREDFEEFLADEPVDYETQVALPGRFDKAVDVDFRVRGHHTTSLILALSTANRAAAHGLANEVFRRWYDLARPLETQQAITVYDTRSDVFREDDLQRLSDVSAVLGFPAEVDVLRPRLAA